MRVLFHSVQALLLTGLLLAVFKPLRERFWDHLESGGGTWPWGPWAAGAGMFAWLGFLKYVQFRGFQLPMDSADQMSTVWGFLHGRGFHNPFLGKSALALHFAPILALFSPALLICPHPLGLFFLQSASLASAGPAAFLLARRKSGSDALGWLALAVVYLNPFFFDAASASFLAQVFIFPLFLWSVYLFEEGRWRLFGACFAALLGCSEQVPFILAGFGVHLAAAGALGKKKKKFLAGAFLALAAAGLWGAEMKLKTHLLKGEDAYWGYYRHLGSEAGDGAASVLARPWALFKAVFWPLSNAGAFGRLLLSAALLPLFSGSAFLVLLAAAAPQLLSVPGTVFHDFKLHNSAYVLGPLCWSALLGLLCLWGWGGGILRRWLAVLLLPLMGYAFRSAPQMIMKDWRPNFYRHGSLVLRELPAGAAVWADEFFAPRVSFRPRVKALPYRALGDDFQRGLFVPEFVLLQKHWALTPEWGPLLTFLAREGYLKAVDFDDILLLRHPAPGLIANPDGLVLPDDDPAAYTEYRRYLLMDPGFEQPGVEAAVRAVRSNAPWVEAAQGLRASSPEDAVIVVSGRFEGLGYCIPLIGRRHAVSLDERLYKVDKSKALANLRLSLEGFRKQGHPTYVLSETFSAKSMTFLLRKYGLAKEEAESLVAPYRPVKAARLKVPGLGEQMLLLMWPTDPQSAALLDKKLRRSGFASHADLARR